MNAKRKGDTLILVGAVLTVVLAIILVALAFVLRGMCDREEIAKDILSGDLDLVKDKDFFESVDYYYDTYKIYSISCVLMAIFLIPKFVLQIVSITTHKKGAYVATLVLTIILNALSGILTIIGCILSIQDKQANKVEDIPFNYARVDNTNANIESSTNEESKENNEN